jgi:hypothetical protein
MLNYKFWNTNTHPVTGFKMDRNIEEAFLREKGSLKTTEEIYSSIDDLSTSLNNLKTEEE